MKRGILVLTILLVTIVGGCDNESDGRMGIVFHCFEYADNPVPYKALFKLLDESGIHTNAVSDIVEDYE